MFAEFFPKTKNLTNRTILWALAILFLVLLIVCISVSILRCLRPVSSINSTTEVIPQIVSDYQIIYKKNDFEIREAKILNNDFQDGLYYGKEPIKREKLREKMINEFEQATYVNNVYSETEEGYPFESGRKVYFIKVGQNWVLDIKRLSESTNKGYESIDLRVDNTFPFKTVYTDFTSEDGIHWSYTSGKLAFTYQIYIPGKDGNQGNYKMSIYEYKNGNLTELSQANSYDFSYAPNYISNSLSYFASKNGELRLIWGDSEFLIGRYNNVRNEYCCDAGLSRVITDGKIIDFYGLREDGMYHIQAGKFD
jgi:hypothetical protein